MRQRSIHPAMRACCEWGSLLLNDKTQVVCGEQACTDWLAGYLACTGFMSAARATVVRAFWRGRAVDQLQTHLRGGGIGETAVGTAADRAGALPVGTGKGGYRIVTVCFDEQSNVVKPIGVCPGYETGSE